VSYGQYKTIRYNQPTADTSAIIFADTTLNFVTDSFVQDLGFVPQTYAKMTKYFKYIGKEDIFIVKSWTGDPHFIYEYPSEVLIPGKIYSFEIYFTQIERQGRFNKAMGFRLSNDSTIVFRFKGTVIPDNKKDFQYFGDYSEGYAPAMYYDNWLFVDASLTKIIDTNYDCIMYNNELSGENYIYGFSEGLAPVKNSDGKIGFIDKTGKLVIDFLYSDTGGFSYGIAPVCVHPDCDNACWGYINKNSEWVFEPQFWSALPINYGMAGVQINGKYGFIDCNGELAIPLIFTAIGRFSDGLCFVSMSENQADFFVINKFGETIIDGPFDNYLQEFRNGKAIVSKKGECLEIDKSGQVLRKLNNSFCEEE